MKHLEEMKQTMSELANTLSDAKLRHAMSSMLLPVSVWLKEMVNASLNTIPAEIESGQFNREDAREMLTFLEDVQKLYIMLIHNEIKKDVADINTGYLMDIENSLSTMCQVFKAQTHDNANHFHPSQSNIDEVKNAMEQALLKSSKDCKTGNYKFFEVH